MSSTGTANVINRVTGSITATSGFAAGLNLSGGGTVQNFGSISSSADSSEPGVNVSGGAGIIFNSGSISGIILNNGGSITNAASGSIILTVNQRNVSHHFQQYTG